MTRINEKCRTMLNKADWVALQLPYLNSGSNPVAVTISVSDAIALIEAGTHEVAFAYGTAAVYPVKAPAIGVEYQIGQPAV